MQFSKLMKFLVDPLLITDALEGESEEGKRAAALDDMISGRAKELPRLVCGVKKVVERASTQDSKGAGCLVALACDYIAKNTCRPGGIDQHDIAKHLGVSVRTLQLRFKESMFTVSILNEIKRVQLENVRRMLTSTDQSIGEITFASGFGSLSRLKALFQKKFGMSMREFRKMSKNLTSPKS